MNTDINLGGRLPLLRRESLNAEQKSLYDHIDGRQIPWAAKAGFKGMTEDGLLIGPFNPFLYSPEVSAGFLQFLEAESEHTSLSKRVREVIILTVGAIWQSRYELYAHSALARQAGLSEQAIAALTAGTVSDDLSPEELIAHQFARQLTIDHQVDATLYERAKHAFGQQGLVDMTFLLGLYLYTCVALNAFNVPVPSEPDKPSAK